MEDHEIEIGGADGRIYVAGPFPQDLFNDADGDLHVSFGTTRSTVSFFAFQG